MDRIYLDHAATTSLLPEVAQAMRPWQESSFGNPSSLYLEGRQAKAAIDEARETLAGALGCEFGEVVFTGSGTEAVNLAILGTALANQSPNRRRILFSAVEHHCVLHTEAALNRLGYAVETIPVDREAKLRLEALESLLANDVLLVAVMHANNELGTIQPAQQVAELSKRYGALFLCDAVQTFLEIPVEADLVAISAHKVHGPKGVGALAVKAGAPIKPVTAGGGQEREMRGGTENVAGIVGFAAAVKAVANLPDNRPASRRAFLETIGDIAKRTVPDAETLPGHLHLRFPGVDAETLLIRFDRAGVSASSGAACSSGSVEASHVLLACGYTQNESREGIRFTFGRATTTEQAHEAANRTLEALEAIRRSGSAQAS